MKPHKIIILCTKMHNEQSKSIHRALKSFEMNKELLTDMCNKNVRSLVYGYYFMSQKRDARSQNSLPKATMKGNTNTFSQERSHLNEPH